MKRLLLCLLVVVFSQHYSYGWGSDGHHAIGQTAERMLSEMTKGHITNILGNTDLAAISNWTDEARALDHNRPNHLSAEEKIEARAFNSVFPKNHHWHFENLPLVETFYLTR